MTSNSNKKDLPPNWVVRTSRQYPSLSYYANVKTGQSTWKHPSLLKESELKCLTKKKRKKNLQDNSSEEEVKVMAVTNSSSGVVKQESRPSKKAKSSLANKEEFPATLSNNKQVESPSNKTVVEDNTGDPKKLKDRVVDQGTQENHQESSNAIGGSKPKPVKFTIKKKNVLSTSSVIDSSPKKSVTVHPSILLAQKIAARDLQLKARKKNMGNREEIITQEQANNTKIKDGIEENSEISVAVTKLDTSESKNDLKNRVLPKLPASNKRSDKKEVKGEERQNHRKKISLSNLDAKLMERLQEKDKINILDKLLGEDKPKKDTSEHRRKEEKMYEDFIKHKSKEWKKSKSDGKGNAYSSTLEAKVSSNEEHSKSFLGNVRPEQPKTEAVEDNQHFGLPSVQVPHVDSIKVFEPLPESVSNDDSTYYPTATDMEIDEKELISEIANFRGSASYTGSSLNNSLSTPAANYCLASVYFVVDTNVLIQDTDFLQQLKSEIVDGRKIVVVVPYVALQELDSLKKSASIGRACQAAVKWCNRHFEAKDPRVLGQNFSNYCSSLDKYKKANADDLVRDCCLLLANEGLDVCLLTNDVNLRNKAMMSSLSAISAKDLKSKLKVFPSSFRSPSTSATPSQANDTFGESQMSDITLTEYVASVTDMSGVKPLNQASSSVDPGQDESSPAPQISRTDSSLVSEDRILHEKITTSLCHTLSRILQDVMKEVYDDLWLTIVKHKPPWSLQEVFTCWDKHWIAVMIDRFPSNMRELLVEIKNLITSSQNDVQKLLKRVQYLYSNFQSKSYRKHILPVQDLSPDAVDMSEASPGNTPPYSSSLPEPYQYSALSGVANVEKMINQVGTHITHFVALVLTAFGIQHKLPTISTCESMTLENARISGINLHRVIMSLGTAITKCLNERTSAALQELGHLLVNFWSEAKLPCPHLPFTECDLRQYVENISNMPFLEGALQELENLIQHLQIVLADP